MSGQDKIIKKTGANTLRNLLFTNWSLVRWIRLAIGLAFLYQAIAVTSLLFAIFSVFFLVQAIANTGCCLAPACSAPVRENHAKNKDVQVQYEEIK